MMFLADVVVDIPVLEGKTFRMDCACSTIESIIISGIFLYGTKYNVDLIIVIFRSDVGSCSHSACVCSVDGNRSASILLNSLSE